MPRATTRAARTRDDDNDEDYHRAPHDGDDATYDEDARPSRRSTTRSRSSDEDSDRESRRASRSEGAREATSTTISRGRAGLRKHQETHKSGDFPDRFQIKNEDVEFLVKFLDDDFIINYYEHEFFKAFEGEKRQKTFICLGEDCPLCAIGNDPKYYSLANVVDLSNPRKPKVKLWYATPNPGDLIASEMDSLEERDKKINDPGLYYVVSKKKQNNGFYGYAMKQVKARDLEEDGYGEPLTVDELKEFTEKAWTDEVVRINKRSELREIAEELNGE